ncbi:ATPase assembly factor ATP10 [Dipodascopsis uninucleata]
MSEVQKSYFQEMRDLGRNWGKEWTAPKAIFRADKALYMPNFYGTTLDSNKEVGSTSILHGKISLVKVYSALSGEKQIWSWFESEDHANGHRPVSGDDLYPGGGYNIVDIYIPESFIKGWISKFFNYRTRQSIPKERYGQFLYAKRLSSQLDRSIGIVNKYAGYLYLVDENCKIRWAASGISTPEEIESLKKSLRLLFAESARNKKS